MDLLALCFEKSRGTRESEGSRGGRGQREEKPRLTRLPFSPPLYPTPHSPPPPPSSRIPPPTHLSRPPRISARALPLYVSPLTVTAARVSLGRASPLLKRSVGPGGWLVLLSMPCQNPDLLRLPAVTCCRQLPSWPPSRFCWLGLDALQSLATATVETWKAPLAPHRPPTSRSQGGPLADPRHSCKGALAVPSPPSAPTRVRHILIKTLSQFVLPGAQEKQTIPLLS